MDTCYLNPFGQAQVLQRLSSHHGFDVWRAEINGIPVALKTLPPTLDGQSIWRSTFNGIETSLYLGCGAKGVQSGFDVYDPTLTFAVMSAILQTEREVIAATHGAWNHSVYGLGTWDALAAGPYRDRFPDEQGIHDDLLRAWPILIMPFYTTAIPLDQLPQDQVRDLIPRMLPSLIHALRVMPHGDLSLSNVMIEPTLNIFRLLDPGVKISSPTQTHNLYSDDLSWITTSAANYPIFPPFWTQLDSTHNLLDALQNLHDSFIFGFGHHSPRCLPLGSTTHPQTSSASRPASSDLMALGINWFRALTGRELFLGSLVQNKPLWCEPHGEAVEFGRQRSRIVKELEEGFIERQLQTPELSPFERRVIGELVQLEISDFNPSIYLKD